VSASIARRRQAAKQTTSSRILWRHVAPNAAEPMSIHRIRRRGEQPRGLAPAARSVALAPLRPDGTATSRYRRCWCLAPWQPRRAHHRFQHLCVWLLYGLFPLQWWFLSDVRELVTGRIGGRQFPPARGRTLMVALAGKALFIGWAFVLPVLLHPSWELVLLWALAIFTLGNVLATVFQLAHCVGEAEFIGSGVEMDWAEHQLATTTSRAGMRCWAGTSAASTSRWSTTCSRESATCTTRRSPGLSRRPAARTGSVTAANRHCAVHSPPTGGGCDAWVPHPRKAQTRSWRS